MSLLSSLDSWFYKSVPLGLAPKFIKTKFHQAPAPAYDWIPAELLQVEHPPLIIFRKCIHSWDSKGQLDLYQEKAGAMQPLKQIRLDSSLRFRRGPAIVRLGVSGAFSIGQGHGGVGIPILLKGSSQVKS